MARQLRDYQEGDCAMLAEAIKGLRAARRYACAVGATRAAAAIQRAIKSTQGAYRHTERLCHREVMRCPCMASMGCLCAFHARGGSASDPCNATE